MAMPAHLYNALKEKLADTKIEHEGKPDVSLLELIVGTNEDEDTGWYQKAEHAKKIQDNSKTLLDENRLLLKERKEKDDKIKTQETEIEKAKESQLSAEDKKEFLKIKKQGMTDDISAKFNAIEQANKELTDKLTTINTDLENERKLRSEATLSSASKELDNRAITTLAKFKIEGTKAEAALAIMRQKGMLGIAKDDNNGGYKEKIRLFKDGKELEANLEKMVEGFAKDNEYLVSGTKSGGTGSEHKGGGASGGSEDRPSATELMKSENKGYDVK